MTRTIVSAGIAVVAMLAFVLPAGGWIDHTRERRRPPPTPIVIPAPPACPDGPNSCPGPTGAGAGQD